MRYRAAIWFIAAAAVMGSALWLGCGVKSMPIPPEEAIPQRIVSLSGISVNKGVQLSWIRPDRYAGGHRMRDLAKFELYRAEGTGGGYHPIAEIPVTDQARFQQQRQFTYVDTETRLGQGYRYQVVSETADGYRSQPSNEAETVRQKPKPPPNPENFVVPEPTPLP